MESLETSVKIMKTWHGYAKIQQINSLKLVHTRLAGDTEGASLVTLVNARAFGRGNRL